MAWTIIECAHLTRLSQFFLRSVTRGAPHAALGGTARPESERPPRAKRSGGAGGDNHWINLRKITGGRAAMYNVP
jgi:hypothetical protein